MKLDASKWLMLNLYEQIEESRNLFVPDPSGDLNLVKYTSKYHRYILQCTLSQSNYYTVQVYMFVVTKYLKSKN